MSGREVPKSFGRLGTARRPESLQIDHFLNRKFKGIWHLAGLAGFLAFFVVDTMRAIDAQSVEQYSGVTIFLDVSYWSGLLLG